MRFIFKFLGTPFFILGVLYEFLVGSPFYGGRLWMSSRILREAIAEGEANGTIKVMTPEELEAQLTKEEDENGEDSNG